MHGYDVGLLEIVQVQYKNKGLRGHQSAGTYIISFFLNWFSTTNNSLLLQTTIVNKFHYCKFILKLDVFLSLIVLILFILLLFYIIYLFYSH